MIELLGNPAIATAILDRLIHCSEIIHLNEKSYRMKHRSSIFGQESDQINYQKSLSFYMPVTVFFII